MTSSSFFFTGGKLSELGDFRTRWPVSRCYDRISGFPPSDSRPEFVETGHDPFVGYRRVLVTLVGVPIVCAAQEATVELTGDAPEAVGLDVINIAPGGWFVAPRRVLAAAVTDLDRTTDGAGERPPT